MAILQDLVLYNGNLSALQSELSPYPWDTEQPYIIITKDQLKKILQWCIDGVITYSDLENGATLVEFRDDLDFEHEWMQEVIEARSRQAAAETAPPGGLYLMRVKYPEPYDFPNSEQLFLL